MRSSAILKPFLNRRFKFLIYIKMITVISKLLLFFFSHTQIHRFRFQLMDNFFHCLSTFSGYFSQSNPHSEYLFAMLRNTRFHNRFYIWIVTSLKSTKRYHRHNRFTSFISSSVM